MQPIALCPKELSTSIVCKSKFCKYRDKKSNCSLDFIPENKEYTIEAIAEALQVSRQRVWRIYDIAVSKLQGKLNESS